MLFNVILAVSDNNGIGYQNTIPWNCPEDLQLFKEKTQDSILIVGRKTAQSLPNLLNREIFVVSRSGINYDYKNNVSIFPTFETALDMAISSNKKIFVAGGLELYLYVFHNYKKDFILHISRIHESCDCDRYFNEVLDDFAIVTKSLNSSFDHYVMKFLPNGEQQYRNLVNDVLNNGEYRVGRNGEVISSFLKHLKFDLRDGFPLLTTKKMFIRGIVEELLFFLKGETNSKLLEEKNVNIWKGNTSREFLNSIEMSHRKEGMMGPMYGYQWRNFNAPYSEETGRPENKQGIDQLANVVDLINKDPHSRRIMMTVFNPEQVNKGVLPPCHSVIIQFYVSDGFLDSFCYNRSSDIGLGLPFNIASTSLMIMIISKLTSLTPRYLNLSLGDAHIYKTHIQPLREQIKNSFFTPSKIVFPDIKNLSDLNSLISSDFILIDYNHYGPVKMEMSS